MIYNFISNNWIPLINVTSYTILRNRDVWPTSIRCSSIWELLIKIIGFKARTSLWNAPTDFWYLFRETALFQGCYSWHLSHHSLRDIGLCPRAVTFLVTNSSNKYFIVCGRRRSRPQVSSSPTQQFSLLLYVSIAK